MNSLHTPVSALVRGLPVAAHPTAQAAPRCKELVPTGALAQTHSSRAARHILVLWELVRTRVDMLLLAFKLAAARARFRVCHSFRTGRTTTQQEATADGRCESARGSRPSCAALDCRRR